MYFPLMVFSLTRIWLTATFKHHIKDKPFSNTMNLCKKNNKWLTDSPSTPLTTLLSNCLNIAWEKNTLKRRCYRSAHTPQSVLSQLTFTHSLCAKWELPLRVNAWNQNRSRHMWTVALKSSGMTPLLLPLQHGLDPEISKEMRAHKKVAVKTLLYERKTQVLKSVKQKT